MTYSDTTWAAFDDVQRRMLPTLARKYARGNARLKLRLYDAGRRRLLDCLAGVEQACGAVDRYDEAAGKPLAVFAYPRLLTALRDAAVRTRDAAGYDGGAVLRLYGEP